MSVSSFIRVLLALAGEYRENNANATLMIHTFFTKCFWGNLDIFGRTFFKLKIIEAFAVLPFEILLKIFNL